MMSMQNWMPPKPDEMPDMVSEVARFLLPAVHTQMNQARLNALHVRQAAIKAMNQSIKAWLDADKQFFELAQSTLPIAHKQTIQMRLSFLEIHEALIAAMGQALEQSMKTDQQLYESCLELLKDESLSEVIAEEEELEEEIEVALDEELEDEIEVTLDEDLDQEFEVTSEVEPD